MKLQVLFLTPLSPNTEPGLQPNRAPPRSTTKMAAEHESHNDGTRPRAPLEKNQENNPPNLIRFVSSV